MRVPERVLVYGVTGSGKTTLAARLANQTGLPWHSVDDLTWEPGWVEVPSDEQRRRIDAICAGQRWIWTPPTPRGSTLLCRVWSSLSCWTTYLTVRHAALGEGAGHGKDKLDTRPQPGDEVLTAKMKASTPASVPWVLDYPLEVIRTRPYFPKYDQDQEDVRTWRR